MAPGPNQVYIMCLHCVYIVNGLTYMAINLKQPDIRTQTYSHINSVNGHIEMFRHTKDAMC